MVNGVKAGTLITSAFIKTSGYTYRGNGNCLRQSADASRAFGGPAPWTDPNSFSCTWNIARQVNMSSSFYWSNGNSTDYSNPGGTPTCPVPTFGNISPGGNSNSGYPIAYQESNTDSNVGFYYADQVYNVWIAGTSFDLVYESLGDLSRSATVTDPFVVASGNRRIENIKFQPSKVSGSVYNSINIEWWAIPVRSTQPVWGPWWNPAANSGSGAQEWMTGDPANISSVGTLIYSGPVPSGVGPEIGPFTDSDAFIAEGIANRRAIWGDAASQQVTHYLVGIPSDIKSATPPVEHVNTKGTWTYGADGQLMEVSFDIVQDGQTYVFDNPVSVAGSSCTTEGVVVFDTPTGTGNTVVALIETGATGPSVADQYIWSSSAYIEHVHSLYSHRFAIHSAGTSEILLDVFSTENSKISLLSSTLLPVSTPAAQVVFTGNGRYFLYNDTNNVNNVIVGSVDSYGQVSNCGQLDLSSQGISVSNREGYWFPGPGSTVLTSDQSSLLYILELGDNGVINVDTATMPLNPNSGRAFLDEYGLTSLGYHNNMVFVVTVDDYAPSNPLNYSIWGYDVINKTGTNVLEILCIDDSYNTQITASDLYYNSGVGSSHDGPYFAGFRAANPTKATAFGTYDLEQIGQGIVESFVQPILVNGSVLSLGASRTICYENAFTLLFYNEGFVPISGGLIAGSSQADVASCPTYLRIQQVSALTGSGTVVTPIEIYGTPYFFASSYRSCDLPFLEGYLGDNTRRFR